MYYKSSETRAQTKRSAGRVPGPERGEAAPRLPPPPPASRGRAVKDTCSARGAGLLPSPGPAAPSGPHRPPEAPALLRLPVEAPALLPRRSRWRRPPPPQPRLQRWLPPPPRLSLARPSFLVQPLQPPWPGGSGAGSSWLCRRFSAPPGSGGDAGPGVDAGRGQGAGRGRAEVRGGVGALGWWG